MKIKPNKYEKIINDIDVGNSVAEYDSLLDLARVETPVFSEILNDKYDVVFGRKGSGKTALFKIIGSMSNYLLYQNNLVILQGVDSHGEPIFKSYEKEFSDFTESEFENFWKIYFISLIWNDFLKNRRYEAKLTECKEEIQDFKNACHRAGIPDIPSVQSKEKILQWLLTLFDRVTVRVPISYTPDKTQVMLIPEVELKKTNEKEQDKISRAIYVNEIGKTLLKILNKSDYKIWIVLDRLDEVFERYSHIEFNGLRGLLRTYKSFEINQNNDHFRIKLFLRDDIKEFLTDVDIYKKYFPRKKIPTLTAITHTFAKESPTLNWTEEEVEVLILKRLLLSKELRVYLEIDEEIGKINKNSIYDGISELLRVKERRKDLWSKIFPNKIGSYNSLKWIFTHLKDSNDIVTPRTVIDLLEEALHYQKKRTQINKENNSYIFPVNSIKEGLVEASKNKLYKDIYNEFPKEQQYIKKLENIGKHKLTNKELKSAYGKDWKSIVDMLKKIGILSYLKNSNSYRIVYLYRPALNIPYKY